MWLTFKRNEQTEMIAVIKNLSPQIPVCEAILFFLFADHELNLCL